MNEVDALSMARISLKPLVQPVRCMLPDCLEGRVWLWLWDAAIVALRVDSSVVARAFLLCTFCFPFLLFTDRGISISLHCIASLATTSFVKMQMLSHDHEDVLVSSFFLQYQCKLA